MPRLPRLLAFAAAALLAAPPLAQARDVLPDLDQQRPSQLEVTTDLTGEVPRFHLGFNSAVDDVGRGPLIIDAHRASAGDEQMAADQVIRDSGGGTRVVRGVGSLQYTYSEDHDHWHFLGFERYELRGTADYSLVAPDQKTGFCLGDRYNTDPESTLPGEPSDPPYTGYCGRSRPGLLRIEEGISVGYGDVYYATLEGQFVDLTGVAPGQYYLVHRANPTRKIVESRYSNNNSSLLIELSWPRGTTKAPSVKVLRACPRRDACPGRAQRPRSLARANAERYAAEAVALALGSEPSELAVACTLRVSRVARRCSASARRYALKVAISHVRTKRGVLFYQYTVTGCRTREGGACARKLAPRSGRVRIGAAPASGASDAVAQPRQRFVAFHDPPLDGVRLWPVVHEVPRLVRHPLGGLGSGLPAQ
jgi:hypothetical protein